MQSNTLIDVPVSATPLDIPGSRVRVAFGSGNLDQLGPIVAASGEGRVLMVTDAGIVAAGHVERAVRSLYRSKIAVRVFDAVEENPTTLHVQRGLRVGKEFKPDLIVGLGGGSSMDCGKGINFLLTNGGQMQDYWGVNKAHTPLLPFIAIPTTAGTGSDAQSFALITDPQTHQKMACGDGKALPRVAILDPDLTATQPAGVAAATAIDAVAHAVETAGCTKRTDISRGFSRAAWQRLSGAFEPALQNPANSDARAAMLLGAHLAGCAIENSMLGAAHALANALTAKFATVHGIAVGMMLPHVIRFNAADANPYADLDADAGSLATRVETLLEAARLPRRLSALGATPEALDELAAVAARQWTATFNPRRVGVDELRSIFASAL
jgi:alcohol dehydrogenase